MTEIGSLIYPLRVRGTGNFGGVVDTFVQGEKISGRRFFDVSVCEGSCVNLFLELLDLRVTIPFFTENQPPFKAYLFISV